MSEYEELIEALIKKYMAEGESEFNARMKAVMSDEALAKVYPNGYDEPNLNKEDI
jgi:hypothetical protein